MARTAMLVNIHEKLVGSALRESGVKVSTAEGEAVLDFSSVCRVDPGMLRALEEFARVADEMAVKIVLRSVKVDVYKVLKLVKLSRRFSFLN